MTKYVATIYFDTDIPAERLEQVVACLLESKNASFSLRKILVDDCHVEQCDEFTDQADAKNL